MREKNYRGLAKFSCKASAGKLHNLMSTVCKFPFLKNGEWIFGCIKGDPLVSTTSTIKSWCPTQMDMKRRFIKGSNMWGYCEEECPQDRKGKIEQF